VSLNIKEFRFDVKEAADTDGNHLGKLVSHLSGKGNIEKIFNFFCTS